MANVQGGYGGGVLGGERLPACGIGPRGDMVTNWDTPVPYPDENGTRYRQLEMPVASPDRTPPAPRPRRGRPGCSECELGETGVCGRHDYDPRASLGITRAQRSPDEWVSDWQAFP